MTEATKPAETAEQVAAKQAAAEKKAAEKAAAKAKKAEESAAKKAAKQAEKEAAKQQKAADKEASKLPEQNGIRRPKANTITGGLWATYDSLSSAKGEPVSIGEALKAAGSVNEATIRTQYARWRKFHGIVGRVEAPKPAEGASA